MYKKDYTSAKTGRNNQKIDSCPDRGPEKKRGK
jgi:hypothetical protein